MKYPTLRFDSWESFVECSTRPETGALGRGSRAPGSWSGTNTFEEALELARTGWKDGLSLIGAFPTLKTVIGESKIAYRLKSDVFGAFPDVGRFLAGHPANMKRLIRRKVVGAGPIIHLVISFAVSGGVSKKTIERRGAAVVALIDALENAGRRVEVDISIGVTTNQGQHETVVRLKDADQPVPPETLAFALAHPATLRRLWFGVAETQTEDVRKAMHYYSGYGVPTEASEKGDIYVPKNRLEYTFNSDAGALEWLKTELTKQGIEA